MAFRPLYKNANINSHSVRNNEGNAGLWFDKFCDQWQEPTNNDAGMALIDDSGKKNWINQMSGWRWNLNDIEDYYERQQTMVKNLNGNVWQFTATSRFITGLGREHPVENGFAWHHVLGAPYLPGTSVKGLLRAYLHNTEAITPGEIETVFGSSRDDGGVGSVMFFDALPVDGIGLEADIMTPHYGDYYQDGKSAPGDWISPTPIPFMVARSGLVLQFAVAPRNPTDAEHIRYAKNVGCWLIEALEWFGAGAKTAVGYGRFIKNENIIKSSRWKKARKEENLAAKSPFERGKYYAKEVSEGAALEWVKENLKDSEKLPDNEYSEGYLTGIVEEYYESWRRGIPKNPPKNIGAKKLREYAALLMPQKDKEESHQAGSSEQVVDTKGYLPDEVKFVTALQSADNPKDILAEIEEYVQATEEFSSRFSSLISTSVRKYWKQRKDKKRREALQKKLKQGVVTEDLV